MLSPEREAPPAPVCGAPLGMTVGVVVADVVVAVVVVAVVVVVGVGVS